MGDDRLQDRMSIRRGSGERVRRPGTVVMRGMATVPSFSGELGRGRRAAGHSAADGAGGDSRPRARGAATGSPGYDGSVTALRRRAANPLLPIHLIVLALVVAACGPGAATTKPASGVGGSTAAAPSLTAVPGGHASPVVGATVGPPTTTSVEGFGTIDDSLPASFPELAGQEPVDPGAGATSGAFVVNGSPAAASAALKSALAGQGWSADVGSPLEDGTIVLEATHAPAGCKTEVRFTPASGSVMMSVLYAASCPFS
jgi:hypothetical protein